jgi:signal-transduction protein with cAMP-binding, CBS, and nucleotidyltransferase domain
MLMGVGLFNCLDKEEFYKLICMIRPLPFKRANDVVLERDSPVETLFLVLKGEFLTCKQNLEDEITSFHSYHEGQVFG